MHQDPGEAVQHTEFVDRGPAAGPVQVKRRQLLGGRDMQPPARAGHLCASLIHMQNMRRGQQGPDQPLHPHQRRGGVAQHLTYPARRRSGTGEVGDQFDDTGDRDMLETSEYTTHARRFGP